MGVSVRFEGISDELRKILVASMDQAPARRRAREAFKDTQLNIDHILFKVVFFVFALFFMCLYNCIFDRKKGAYFLN